MELTSEHISQLSDSMTENNDNIESFSEAYKKALDIASQQYDLLKGDIRSLVTDLAEKSRKIQISTTQTTVAVLDIAKSVKFIQNAVAISMTDNNKNRVEKAIKSEMSVLGVELRKVRNAIESGTTEGGLEQEGGMGGFFRKMQGILTNRGSVNNTTVVSTSNESSEKEGGWLSTILKVGGLFAGIAVIWGIIQNNPQIKEFFTRLGETIKGFWKDHLQGPFNSLMEEIWENMKIGSQSIWDGIWNNILVPIWNKFNDAVGGNGGLIASTVGMAGGIALLGGGISGLFTPLGLLALSAGIAAKAIYDWGERAVEKDKELQKNLSLAQSTSLRDNEAEKSKNLGEEYDKLSDTKLRDMITIKQNIQISSEAEAELQRLKNDVWLTSEEDVKRQQTIVDNLHKQTESALRRGKETIKRMEEIESGKGKMNDIREKFRVYEVSEIKPDRNTVFADGKVLNKETRSNTLIAVNNQERIIETTKILPQTPPIDVSETNQKLDAMVELLTQNNEINIQGHSINAQVTANSVPPPPVINFPKQSVGPNSSRKLAHATINASYPIS